MKRIAVLASLLLAGQVWAAQPVAQFSADQVIVTGSQQFSGKVAVSGRKSRSELAMHNMVMLRIARADQGKTLVVIPARKEAREMPMQLVDVMLTYLHDPKNQRVQAGTEKVGGVQAIKYRIKSPAGLLHLWVNKFTQAPLQAATDDGVVKLSWKNVKIGPQAAKLFEVPAGYKRVADSGAAR